MGMTPWVMRLIVANVVVFFLQYSAPGIIGLFVLLPARIVALPWTAYTILTYMFLHGGFFHLFVNMLGLFFFGPRLELQLGSRRFLWLYFLSGIGGALLSFVFAFGSPIIGASAAVFGVLVGFAMFWPREPIYIWGILPIQARLLVMITAAFSLWAGISGAQAGVAHFAHLGGFAAGWLYLKYVERRERRRRQGGAAGPTTLERVSGRLQREEKHWRAIDPGRFHEINRSEIERILGKIDRNGLESLTRDEREFMNRMSG
ncbi:MAG: rhomboid family intramembrane serine protease [Longimicrobiales bacterium]